MLISFPITVSGMEMDQEGISDLFIAGLIGLVLGFGSLGVFVVSRQAIDQTTIQTIDVIVGTVLSAALVILYSLQSNTSSNQKEIEEGQKEIQEEQKDIQEDLLKLKKRARLKVTHWDFEEDTVYLDIANYGNGGAEDLELLVNLQIDQPEWYSGHPVPCELSKVNSETGESINSGAIHPREDSVRFKAKAFLGNEREDGSIDEFYFEALFEKLSEIGTSSSARIYLQMQGRNELGDEFDLEVRPSFEVNPSNVIGNKHIENVYKFS